MKVAVFITILCSPALAASDRAFDADVTPFLNTHCAACHGGKIKMGGIAVEAFRDASSVASQSGKWERMLQKIRTGEMPPVGRPKPPADQVARVAHWIETELDRTLGATVDPGRVTAHRLNRAEYNNSVRDLLAVDFRAADEFPADDAGYGFDNIADVLSLPPLLMEKYLAAAGKIARLAIPTSVEKIDPTVQRYPFDRKARAGVPLNDDMPFGTRGGVFVEHRFPAEADYVFLIRFRGQQNPVRPARVDIRFDGKRVELIHAKTSAEEEAEDRRRVDLKLHVPYGEHTFAATFLKENGKSEAPDPLQRGATGEAGIDFVEVRGPYNPLPLPPPESQKRLYAICGHPEGGHPESAACARKIVAALARRAYRRPVADREVDGLLRFVTMARSDGGSFAEGLQLAIKAMLVSPHFLFRIERDPADGAQRVTDLELASRLSYFLWSSIPDEELLRLAEQNRLHEPGVLKTQVARLLADRKSKALVENFAGQWLQLRNLPLMKPDPQIFPGFDNALRAAMGRETEMFFEAVMREDRSLLDFIDGRFTFLNERLAKHYGIPGVEGAHFRRVNLEGNQRGGVLTQGSILTISSYPTRTSPVIRGKWILENILGAPPPPPPPGVPDLNAADVGTTGTMRQQLEKHRSNAACAACHARMDAIGFGLENYDAIGAWRSLDGKFPIDASGAMPGGAPFATPAELKAILRGQRTEFGLNVTEKLLTYALGRGLERYDKPVVRQIGRQLEADGFRFSSLVMGIVESAPFQMRRAEVAKR